MGSTLYNKIYLGRRSLRDSPGVLAALAFGVVASVGLGWAVLRGVR